MTLIFYLFRFTWLISSLVALLTLVSSFQEMMESEFQMSMMGELTFFLGIQVKQIKQDTSVHQAKYTKDLMKKFNMAELKPLLTPMSMATTLDLDKIGEAVDQREYRSMIDSLLYLTATHPGIQFTVGLCALSAFPTLFTSDCSSTNLQVSQTQSGVWDLIFCFFFTCSCWLFRC
jgi:hypothetical protein